jgi:hypothetical protein
MSTIQRYCAATGKKFSVAVQRRLGRRARTNNRFTQFARNSYAIVGRIRGARKVARNEKTRRARFSPNPAQNALATRGRFVR